MISANHWHLVIRADGGGRTGAGHIMRCISIAQAWHDIGGKVSFLSHCHNKLLRNRIRQEGWYFEAIEKPFPHPGDLKQTQDFLARHASLNSNRSLNCAILDGYHFDSSYHDAIKERALKLLVIDDMAHLKRYNADIILNQNLGSEQLRYSCDANAQLLLGPKYALLRKEFWQWKDWKRRVPEISRKILVTMGGSDPDNVTMKVVEAIKHLDKPELEVKVVIGPANQHASQLEAAMLHVPCSICCVNNQPDMPELMAWADLAVSGAGSTCWELAFMGVPLIILVLADNQEKIAGGLDSCGTGINLGWFGHVTSQKIAKELIHLVRNSELREEMSHRSRSLVDGQGCHRTAEIIATDFERK